jgi:N-acetyl-anhydromuramyl-L-alanine amidase AmpD
MTYRKGDKGDMVKIIQKALGLTADGIFGAKTEEAVKQYQNSHNLTVDGIVGNATLKSLGIVTDNNNKTNIEMDITLSPITKHMTKKSREIKYIVIHYTAGSSSKKGSAMNTRNLFQNSNRDASADFCVDDETIVQTNSDPTNYYCWAVGDGKGKYGITNSNCISIEMCSTLKSGTSAVQCNHTGWSISDKVLDNTEKLVKYLMEKYNIPLDRVVRHYDASRKSCPGIIGWNDNETYSESGKIQTTKNNSNEWVKFKERLKQ